MSKFIVSLFTDVAIRDCETLAAGNAHLEDLCQAFATIETRADYEMARKAYTYAYLFVNAGKDIADTFEAIGTAAFDDKSRDETYKAAVNQFSYRYRLSGFDIPDNHKAESNALKSGNRAAQAPGKATSTMPDPLQAERDALLASIAKDPKFAAMLKVLAENAKLRAEFEDWFVTHVHPLSPKPAKPAKSAKQAKPPTRAMDAVEGMESDD